MSLYKFAECSEAKSVLSNTDAYFKSSMAMKTLAWVGQYAQQHVNRVDGCKESMNAAIVVYTQYWLQCAKPLWCEKEKLAVKMKHNDVSHTQIYFTFATASRFYILKYLPV